jgi:hypothetical protein
MVQSMESWFLADKEALQAYYGNDFNVNSLPRRPDIEAIPKRDVLAALENATHLTKPGSYHKTRHGFDILGRIDPTKVREASSFADRLCARLSEPLSPAN